MAKIRIPLIGSPNNRATDLQKDQRFVNCFPEVIQTEAVESKQTYLLKRNGTAYVATPGAIGEGRGIYSWNNKLFIVVADKVYSRTSSGTVTEIKTLTTSTGPVGFSEWTAANDYLILLDGTKGYYISTTDVVTEISDPQFPTPHLPYPVFMDGYLFVQKTTGEIFNCDITDVTAWQSTSYITPESYPDGAVAICRQNNLLTALGINSVEFFYDAAAAPPGSPLRPNQQAIIQYGCAAGMSVAQEEGLVIFVSQSATGEKFVSVIQGTKDKTISTEAINRILTDEGTDITDCWAFLTRQKGHLLYVLNLVYQDRTLVYDIGTNLWHEWEWFDGDNDGLYPMADATEFGDEEYFIHVDNGKIYKASPTVYQDDSLALKVLIQTARFDADTGNVKFCSRTEVLGDWQTSTSNLNILHTDDDYKTWTAARTIDLSTRAYIYRCGSFRRRAWRLYSEANTPLRLHSIEIDLTGGSH